MRSAEASPKDGESGAATNLPRVDSPRYNRDGVFQGIQFFAIRPGALLDLLGLRNGDTVVSVNGRALTRVEVEAFLDVWRVSSGVFELEIARDDHRFTFELRLKDC